MAMSPLRWCAAVVCGLLLLGLHVHAASLSPVTHAQAQAQAHARAPVSNVELESPFYVTGAVQWAPYGSWRDSSDAVIALNMRGFVSQAEAAHQQGVQVLLFPEGGIGMFNANTRDSMLGYCESIPIPSYTIPHPSHHHFPARSNINPCNGIGGNWSTTSQLYILSCSAQQQQLILVFNTCDVQTCSSNTDPKCPADGRYQFNTQVVFNEHGELLAKYHKVHLFGETVVFNQASPIAVTFDTSLGVTFGTFICFDIEYEAPALTLVELGITHILFSTWWGNTLPAFVATMIQQGFSRQHQIALIAANTGAGVRRSGGGIFVSGEPLVQLYDTHGPDSSHVRQLLVAKVPITVPRQRTKQPSLVHHHSASSDDSPSSFPSTSSPCTIGPYFGPGACALFTPTPGFYSLQSTFGSISCSADITVSHAVNETWALWAYQASLQYPNTPDLFSVEICSITQCKNQGSSHAVLECEEVTSSSTIMSSFVLTGIGFNPSTRLFPTVTLDNAQVQPVEMLHVDDHLNGTLRTIQATNGQTIKNTMFAVNLFGVSPNPKDTSNISMVPPQRSRKKPVTSPS